MCWCIRKTGWANQQSTVQGVEEVTSDEFPEDSAARIQNAHVVLTQLTGSGLITMQPVATTVAATQGQVVYPSGMAVPQAGAIPVVQPAVANAEINNVAEAAINAALGLPASDAPSADGSTSEAAVTAQTPAAAPDPKEVGGAESPTCNVLVHNMFDKDEETEEGWEEEIRLDFEDECSKYGKIQSVVVMTKEPGGKIYASFDSHDGAKACAENLAGRWFDKRQLRVEYVTDEDVTKAKSD